MTKFVTSWISSIAQSLRGQALTKAPSKLDLARIDPNYFIRLCFTDSAGKPLRQSRVHTDLQAFLTANPKALVELPRDHGKSTQVCARLAWELGRDPSLRIKIVCASDALAAERGRFIRDAIANNERLGFVFPKLKPAQPWSETRFTVERPANVIGPSLTAIGVGAASTGTRADLLVCDDIVDVKALASRAERERVKNHFRENLMNLLEPDGRFWGLCTPWHRDDLNAELKRSESFPLFRKAIGDDLKPVWPERWPREALAKRRDEIGVASFARGYRLVPMADEDTMIRRECVQFWDDQIEAERVILAIDPAVSTHKRADCSALVVLAKRGPKIHCAYAEARRVEAWDLIQWIKDVDVFYRPETILFESNAAFLGIADLMKRQESFGPKVMSIQHTKDKGSRVSAFSVQIRNGSFRLRGKGPNVDPLQQELMDEITTFPQGEHDDLLDAAAMGTAYLLGVTEPRIIG